MTLNSMIKSNPPPHPLLDVRLPDKPLITKYQAFDNDENLMGIAMMFRYKIARNDQNSVQAVCVVFK